MRNKSVKDESVCNTILDEYELRLQVQWIPHESLEEQNSDLSFTSD